MMMMNLNALKEEVKAKRKIIEETKKKRAREYVTKADVESVGSEEMIEQEEMKRKKAQVEEAAASAATLRQIEDLRNGNDQKEGKEEKESKEKSATTEGEEVIDEKEVMKKLRLRGQPITLFGEDGAKRAERLKELEETQPIAGKKEELQTGEGNAILKMLKEMDKPKTTNVLVPSEKRKEKEEEKEKEKGVEEESVEERIGKYLKELISEWERILKEKGEEQLHTRQGRQAFITYKQCKDNLQPLFDLLKRKNVHADVLRHIEAIVGFLKIKEYIKANDEYLAMAIGNAAWPMGVTMVGIHERAAREKIFTNSVAHILNDETTRKYLQSIKRLITFCQKRFPTDPSHCVEYGAFDL